MSDKKENSKAGLGALTAMLRFLAPYKMRVLGATLALIFTASITLLVGQGLRILVDRGFGEGTSAGLDQAVLIMFGIVLLLALGTFVRFYLVSWIGERVSADLRCEVFNNVVELHPGFFESNLSTEIQSRITTDTTLIQTVIGSSVSIALRNLLMFIGGLILLLVTNPKLTAIVLLSVPLVVLPIIIFGRRVRNLSRSSQDQIANVGSFVGEALKHIKVLHAFNHQETDQLAFGKHVERAFNVARHRIRQRALLTTVVMTLVMGAISIMLWVGGHDVIAGRITAGELIAFVFYAIMVAGSVGAFSEVYGDLQRAAGATERLMELMHEDSLIVSPESPTPLSGPAQGRIDLENVCFAYESRPETMAINELSLSIEARSSLALVGSSGAGKSTLVDLILRFYDVQKGLIRFDGIDIRDLDLTELRSHIAIVPQQPVLFSSSIIENIRYGRPDATDQEVRAAAEAAFADEFISRLPEGYDSFVGDSGVRLSGGQRQRIAIARAILKDPSLLLLDEATSALDAESEFKVQQALELLMENRTTLIIAHRLATVKHVDRIAVLDHGRLKDIGTHQQLLKHSELYGRWADLQFDSGKLAKVV